MLLTIKHNIKQCTPRLLLELYYLFYNFIERFKLKKCVKTIKKSLLKVELAACNAAENEDQFLLLVISQITDCLKTKVKNNYDFLRFQNNVIVNERKRFDLFYLKFFIKNKKYFFQTYCFLSDDYSKKVYIKLILYRILGHQYVQIKDDLNWEKFKKIYDEGKEYYVGKSDLNFSSEFGSLEHFEQIPIENSVVKIDSFLASIGLFLDMKQYYFCREKISIKPEKGDVVIDAGACIGDTAVIFANSVGEEGHVYSFDPLLMHGDIINFNAKQNNFKNIITYVPYGIGNLTKISQKQNDVLDANIKPGFNLFEKEDFSIIAIDDFCKKYDVSKIDFIKMDIEGFELDALKGARGTIAKYKPKLAICLYHKNEDFFAIPLWLKNNFPEYKLYLDHYTIHKEETVLYGIID